MAPRDPPGDPNETRFAPTSENASGKDDGFARPSGILGFSTPGIGGGGPGSVFAPSATSFDEYRLIRCIGRGGMGEVWLADDVWLDRRVAIKFIGWLDTLAEVRQQFLQEARLAARLSHPNVVTIYRVGEKGGKPFIVTELLQGKSLKELEKPLPVAEVLRIGIGLARGLGAAHRAGILHCDIKPANAIATENGEIKLLDFGLARFYDPARPRLAIADSSQPASESTSSSRNTLFGTPRYLAPEIWNGEMPTPRSDVYSLGAVLYELCTGAAPNDDIGSSPEFHALVTTREAPRLGDAVAQLDPRLCEVVAACLAVDPARRFPSAEELCLALEDVATGGPRSGLPEGNPYRGLSAFEAEHRSLFFGRGRETRAIVDRLRGQSIVLVAADSGLGKSSLCRAGVIPEILDGALGDGRAWTAATMMPMDRPIEMLAAALISALGWRDETGAVAERMRRERSLFAREVRKKLGREMGLLLFVDQMEELSTLAEPREVGPFCEILAALGRDAPGVRILGAVRGDFVSRIASLPEIADEACRGIYVLGPATSVQIREAIVGPAEAKGVRFESEALVNELVASVNAAAGGLPLLQFTLTELWESRDRKAAVMTEQSLIEMGGVEGALSRHADGVMASMLPERRKEAFRILVALVSSHGTRARKKAEELPGEARSRAAALEALVRGRILQARDVDGTTAYELSHEALIRGWRAFALHLDEVRGARVVHERLFAAVLEWERLGGTRDATYSERQLRELEAVAREDLSSLERAFVAASERVVWRAKWLKRGLFLAAPVLLVLLYLGLNAQAKRDLRVRTDAALGEAHRRVDEARRATEDVRTAKKRAFAIFDQGELEKGDVLWRQVLSSTEAADASWAAATQEVEASARLSPERADVEAFLREVLYEHALFAEESGEQTRAQELVSRATVYDPTGELLLRFREKGHLNVTSEPSGAAVAFAWYPQTKGMPWSAMGEGGFDLTPRKDEQLPPGSYVLTFQAEGRADVHYPFVLTRGEKLDIHVYLPDVSEIPPGFVYIPPGKFLLGSNLELIRTTFLETAPMHEVKTGEYLIAKNETTFGEWIDYLRALDPTTQTQRLPRIREEAVPLLERGDDGRFTLRVRFRFVEYVAREGEPLRYKERTVRAEANWLRMPVVGISIEDAAAYAKWLADSGRVKGARLCTEWEWERAARGADGRTYSGGDRLVAADANVDGSYPTEGMGPDEVGQFPQSRSPFGIDDMIGNVWEWTVPWTKDNQSVRRGGSFRQPRAFCQADNRGPDSLPDMQTGVRICATPSWSNTK